MAQSTQMQRWVVVAAGIALGACGGSPRDPQQPIASSPAPAATSCTDVGVILRGQVEDAAKAGVAREATIAAACSRDRWSPAVVACIGASRKPQLCLDKLTHAQHAGYDAKIAQWSEQYGGGAYGGVDYAGAQIPDHYADCADVTGDVGRYPPALGATAPERDWDIAARSRVIAKSCEYAAWSEVTKECLEGAALPDEVAACMANEATHDGLESEVTAIDAVAAKIAAAKKKPASIECKKVAVAWFSETRWKDKLAALKSAERAKQLAAARASMQKTCVADKWADTTRACLVVDGGERCFTAANLYAGAWSLGGSIPLPPNAPHECAEYAASIQRLLACDKLPQAARDAMRQGYDAMAAGWATADASVATACKAANDAVVQTGKAACNW